MVKCFGYIHGLLNVYYLHVVASYILYLVTYRVDVTCGIYRQWDSVLIDIEYGVVKVVSVLSTACIECYLSIVKARDKLASLID